MSSTTRHPASSARPTKEAGRESVGNQIRLARIDRGMTQEDLARRVGRSVPTISKIEAGKQSIDVDSLIAICRSLRISPAAVLLKAERGRADDNPVRLKVLDILDSLMTAIEQP